MATAEDNNVPWLNGKKSGTVYYKLNDTLVARGIGKNNKEPSLKQKTARLATAVTSAFLNEVMPYVNIGFQAIGRMTKTNQQNQAFSYNRKNAVRGTYPDVVIDYTKVLLSIGNKPLPTELKAFVAEDWLIITWNTELTLPNAFWDDQVIIMAYFPQLKNSVFLSGGAKRYQGTEHVPLKGIKRGYALHVFFSIISNDRANISNSIYLGEMNW